MSINDEGVTEYEYDEVIVEANDAKEALLKGIVKLIDEYDTSDAVNSFCLGDQRMWLPLEERKSMRQSLIALKAMGVEEFTYWMGLIPITMPVEQFEQILNALEVYALRCYNVTAMHKSEVMTMPIDDVVTYDYKAGYPDKLSF